MTVLHVVVAGEVGGAERMLVDLAQGVDRRHVIALLTPNDRLRALFRDAGLDVEDHGKVREDPVSFLRRTLGRRELDWLTGVGRRREAKLVHLHTFGSQVLGTRAAIAIGAKVVRTEHSTRVYDDPSCWPFSKWSLERTDVAVAISEHVRRVALAKAPWAANKLRVVPNGVDVERFVPQPMPPVEARVRFVATGRLEPRKGLDKAIAAVARVPRAELEIVGEGESHAKLQALAAKLGVGARVRFSGYATDVRPAIARAHVALSSAREEGLGIALLEAMAMGRPVVALPTGGIPEIVKHGETGWLAVASDVEALARAMQEAVDREDERARRGDRARAWVSSAFSIAAMRRGYEEVYSSLLF